MDDPEVARLAALVDGRRIFALVGAGCSTESGIPDYRGSGATPRVTAPLQYKAFVNDPATRRRYWARAYAGWARMAGATPNAGHHALVALEAEGRLGGLVTQNVDGLHHRAGHRDVIELHGALRRVVCLDCGARVDRDLVQEWIADANPGLAPADVPLRPDGDASVGEDELERFVVPACRACGGRLKPDVVLFGENVARPIVDAAYACLDASDVVLVIGSSLTVFSGYRFVARAAERGLPVGIVNLSPTRGDALAEVRVARAIGEVLPALVRALVAQRTAARA